MRLPLSAARAVVVTALMLLFAAPAAAAGIVTSSLTGRVTAGEQGAAGVRVTLTSPVLQATRTTVTNADGRYFIDAVVTGRYDVTFERPGLQSLTRPVVVELGRVARADARLEPSEDEESVTSTAMTTSVVDTTALTSHFSRTSLDRLPLRSDATSVFEFAPAAFVGSGNIDGAPLIAPVLGYEVVDEVTVLRGGLPAGLESFAGGILALQTRSGTNDFSLSVRDTWVDAPLGRGHFFESASGGRIVPDRLWFFAGGWSGDHAHAPGVDGFEIKLTSRLGNAHSLTGMHLDSDVSNESGSSGSDTTFFRYTGVLSDRATVDAVGGRATLESGPHSQGEEFGTAKLSYTAGRHVLRAGGTREDEETSFFASDRVSWGNVTLDAGLRHSGEDGVLPRIAAIWDIDGNGRRAVAASHGEYGNAFTRGENMRLTALGFVTAIGTSGSARIDVMRREFAEATIDQIQLESRYSLFDRFELGASWSHNEASLPALEPDIGRVWAGAQLPLGEHELGMTLVERYDSGAAWATDLAIRYIVPFRRVAFTLGGDAIGLFDDARTLRFWARVRL